jgi:hypothetical protein
LVDKQAVHIQTHMLAVMRDVLLDQSLK